MRRIITITRQFGSLGRPIARRLAEKTGMKYYDRDIIDISARNLGMNVEDLLAFQDSSATVYDRMLYPLGKGTLAQQDRVYKMEKSVILELATEDDCVFVGRGVDYLLRDFNGVFSVYVYSPIQARLRNSVETLGLTETDAEKYVAGVDRARNAFYRRCAGDEPIEQYRDLCIDSSRLGVEGTAEIIQQGAEYYFQRREKREVL